MRDSGQVMPGVYGMAKDKQRKDVSRETLSGYILSRSNQPPHPSIIEG